MAKELTKFKGKSRRKPEYAKAGMAQQESLAQEKNKGRPGMEINNVILGGKKRGHGRDKASDAGPTRKAA